MAERLLSARLRVAAEQGDTATLGQLHGKIWAGERGAKFHATKPASRLQFFTDNYAAEVTPVIDALLSDAAFDLQAIVDLGCGDGQVLGYLDDRFDLPPSIGIDISAEAIEMAKAAFADRPKLTFHHADMRRTLETHVQPNCLVMTHAGVLEYFTSAEVDELIAGLAEKAPVEVLLVEPLAGGFEMRDSNDLASIVFGRESSFSHNYIGKFRAGGFTINKVTEIPLRNFPRLAVISASKRS